ncbi:hypothetical protein N0V85_008924 [Neurospora sp. IMI 360204]|nr:hypothetical protein N0V85_008924 [Neurospora sp. IMI 360204]
MKGFKSFRIPNSRGNSRGTSDRESPNKITEISPTGDIILAVGEDDQQKRLRVESAVLCHSSKVFAAMFSPPWVESEGLGSAAPKEIRLPEDSFEAMKAICYIVHSQNSLFPVSMTAQKFLNVVLHIDKYDLGRALRATTESWWRRFLNIVDGLSEVDLIHLIVAAHLLKEDTMFPKLTICLMVRNTSTDTYTDFMEDPFLADLLPAKLFGA